MVKLSNEQESYIDKTIKQLFGKSIRREVHIAPSKQTLAGTLNKLSNKITLFICHIINSIIFLFYTFTKYGVAKQNR